MFASLCTQFAACAQNPLLQDVFIGTVLAIGAIGGGAYVSSDAFHPKENRDVFDFLPR